jgi:hypothetical protein
MSEERAERTEFEEALQRVGSELQRRADAVIDGIRSDREAAERKITVLEFERLVRENAVLGGVLPKAVKYIVEDVRELFELRDNALVVRNGETNPGDPLTPLSFEVWLRELRKKHEYLFVKADASSPKK